ncbi:Hypothetical predicted protein [Pelobates cultripes]|uniref:Uncharacterized protein n=1 Tax=Pelobates cultripes TaxID=61616 RepID=A0AAD1TJC4_PELCU|nr:Hypothetical predicted protein [Pelobates cultripes]
MTLPPQRPNVQIADRHHERGRGLQRCPGPVTDMDRNIHSDLTCQWVMHIQDPDESTYDGNTEGLPTRRSRDHETRCSTIILDCRPHTLKQKEPHRGINAAIILCQLVKPPELVSVDQGELNQKRTTLLQAQRL